MNRSQTIDETFPCEEGSAIPSIGSDSVLGFDSGCIPVHHCIQVNIQTWRGWCNEPTFPTWGCMRATYTCLPVQHSKLSSGQAMILSFPCRVLHLVREGWPQAVAEELWPFASRIAELSVQDGCLLWGNQVVVPSQG